MRKEPPSRYYSRDRHPERTSRDEKQQPVRLTLAALRARLWQGRGEHRDRRCLDVRLSRWWSGRNRRGVI